MWVAGPVWADMDRAQSLYEQHCAECHGLDGESVMLGIPSFKIGEGLSLMDPQMLDFVKAGKGVMPAYADVLSDEEIFDIIFYLRTLWR